MMKNNLEIMSIIPARGGSKGLPGKNLADLGNMPLIAHSVNAARDCKWIQRVVVSTDSIDIASVAKDWGAEVPFLRPESLSGDNEPVGSALEHTLKKLERLEGYSPDVVVLLFPTHPFRSSILMNELTQALASGYSRVKTVKRVVLRQNAMYRRSSDRRMETVSLPVTGERTCYRCYGIFDGFHRYSAPMGMYLYEVTGVFEKIDIDSLDDLMFARRLWPEWKERYGCQTCA
jgi:CMP-N-acetylneuraminic acid synthetase